MKTTKPVNYKIIEVEAGRFWKQYEFTYEYYDDKAVSWIEEYCIDPKYLPEETETMIFTDIKQVCEWIFEHGWWKDKFRRFQIGKVTEVDLSGNEKASQTFRNYISNLYDEMIREEKRIQAKANDLKHIMDFGESFLAEEQHEEV